jgi:hypothetical protein
MAKCFSGNNSGLASEAQSLIAGNRSASISHSLVKEIHETTADGDAR